MSFMSVMDWVGKEIKTVWSDVVKYLPGAAAIAALIFPGEAGTTAAVVSAVDLIQQAVATVEQKFAAAGMASATGPQKLAQVLSIVTPTVTQVLAQEKITADSAYITNIVNAVVAVLNAQAAPAAPAAT